MTNESHAVVCNNRAKWHLNYTSKDEAGKVVALEYFCVVHMTSIWLSVPKPTNFERIREFIAAFDASHEPSLWLKLIDEETAELKKAIAEGDLVSAFDGICDLLYVTYGCGESLDFPVDEGYAEVHRSNMTKLGEDGKPIHREDGKVLKGPNFEPPKLAEILQRSGFSPMDLEKGQAIQ